VILPKGTTGDRVGLGSTAGALRYNTDSNKVELWDGNQWVEVQSSRPDLNGGARGVFGGGYTPTAVNTLEYITISSTGNAQDFGDLTRTSTGYVSASACSSSTRGLLAGGYPMTTAIDYWTFSSTGNAASFGSLTVGRYGIAAVANSTRGVFTGGNTVGNASGINNTIDYVTIASTGNAVDFGDTVPANHNASSCASPTRGIMFGGSISPGVNTNIIDFITISTLGNSVDFGYLTSIVSLGGGVSNATRGINAGGYSGPSSTIVNTIEYITIATLGNSADFGDLINVRAAIGTAESSTRGVFAGGSTPSLSNIIDYITIQTQGNAVDFGDLTVHGGGRQLLGGCSNAHGGL